jgi:hypothetical protein
MQTIPKQDDTAEFKEQAVKRVTDGKGVGVAAHPIARGDRYAAVGPVAVHPCRAQGAYGRPRMVRELRARGVPVSTRHGWSDA